jgi:hypothetical protein
VRIKNKRGIKNDFVKCFLDILPRKRGDEGDSDTQTKTTNFNLTQGKRVDDLRTSTSYFDKDWNTFTQEKDGSM